MEPSSHTAPGEGNARAQERVPRPTGGSKACSGLHTHRSSRDEMGEKQADEDQEVSTGRDQAVRRPGCPPWSQLAVAG